jgi:multiple sugar transport system permease protein
MSSMDQALAAGAAALPPRRHRSLHGADLRWSIAFLLPYAAVFAGFVLYPMGYGLWMGSDPQLYAALFADPRYLRAALNTLVFVAVAVNGQMVLGLLLSGFFQRKRRWIRALLVVFLLPWTVPAVPAFLSFHWMLVAEQWGLIDRLLQVLFGISGPAWFADGKLALASDIVADIWKGLPLWTLIFIAGRLAIPEELFDAAAVDGASAWQRFRLVTLPLLANLYLVTTLIATIWSFSDYAPVLFVSAGTPAFTSDVLSTLGFHYALDFAMPRLGVAAGLSALPLLIPLALFLMSRLKASEVEL